MSKILSSVNLPSHDHCSSACKEGNETALERFIHDHEPAGNDDEALFRNQLTAVVHEVIGSNSLQEHVFRSLRNALENEYDATLGDPRAIAIDMKRYDSTYENIDVDDIALHVEAWQGDQNDGVHDIGDTLQG